MNVSIIIPNYNGKHLLEKNLPFVLKASKAYTDGKVEIIISDDHSSDDSVNFLQSFIYSHSDYHIIITENKGVQGFAANVNNGARLASGDILFLLNTDVVPSEHFLEPLIKHFQDEKVFAVGCLEKTTDKGEKKEYGKSVGIFQRGFITHHAVEATGRQTFWVSCGSGAFRKSIWDELKGLDEIYNPFYWEDIDLSYRGVKFGYMIRFEPKSIVEHNHEEGAIKTTFSSKKVTSIAYRNQFIFIWKNITDTDFLEKHILWLPYHIVKAASRGEKEFFSGFIKAIFLLPNIIQSRRQMQKQFRLSDKQVLQQQKVS